MFQNPEAAFGSAQAMLEVIEKTYAAVQQPEVWTEVLGDFSRLLGGDSIALFSSSPGGRTPALAGLAGIDATVWDDFESYYSNINPLFAAGEKTFRPDESWYSHIAVPDGEFLRTEFYNDFFRPNDMHYSLGLLMAVDYAPRVAVSVQRSRARGVWPAQAEVVAQTMRPHLQRAVNLFHWVQHLRTINSAVEVAMDAHQIAVLAVDARERVVFSTSAAMRLLERSGELMLRQERLACRDEVQQANLTRMLAAAINRNVVTPADASASVLLRGSGGRPNLQITISPFSGSIPKGAGCVRALIFLSDPGGSLPSRASVLRQMYGLTPAECRVADHLLAGLDAREIGEKSGQTHDTVRFHIKRILAKTGMRRQSEVVRLMLSLPAFG